MIAGEGQINTTFQSFIGKQYWLAWTVGREDGPIGYGFSKDEAIEDLKESPRYSMEEEG